LVLDVSGADLAQHLRDHGLQNRAIDLRLWCCLGAMVTRLRDAAGNEILGADGQGIDSSFLLQFASALQETHPRISFTGYTHPVSIDPQEIAVTGVKKVAVTSATMGSGSLTLAGTSAFKVTVEAVKTNGCLPCYLTTATCLTLGLPDNCTDLRTLRWFRDHVLSRSGEGKRAIADYYAIAPALVRRIGQRSDAVRLYHWLHERHIRPAVMAIKAGRYDNTFQGYKLMVGHLTQLVENSNYHRTTTSTGSDGRVLLLPSVPSAEKAW
jgi:hypothetical protein